MMRREFITLLGGAAAAWPLVARAQQPKRLALLGSGAAQSTSIFVEALKQGLAENGLIEGKGYVLDVRWAEGEYGRFPALATDAVKQNSDLILATTIAAVRAAQRALVNREVHQRASSQQSERASSMLARDLVG